MNRDALLTAVVLIMSVQITKRRHQSKRHVVTWPNRCLCIHIVMLLAANDGIVYAIE